MTGATSSADFPLVGGFDNSWGGMGDGYVVKLDPTGTSILWSTYVGGSGNEAGHGIAVDAGGNVYVAGYTTSTDFPVPNGLYTSLNGTADDAFVVKIAPSGGAVLWGTYLGGSASDKCNGLAIDGSGGLFLVGETWSADFPMAGPFDPVFALQTEAFVAKIDGNGPALPWSSYLGGGGNESANAVASDPAGDVYVTGEVTSSDFPTTGGFDTAIAGTGDVFVTKLSGTGTGPIWSTFLGGANGPVSGYERGDGIAVDPAGNVLVTGRTGSDTFPTSGGFDTTYGGQEDSFLAKISASGGTLLWSTYLGGSDEDEGYALAVDAAGDAYVTGMTRSVDFPMAAAFDGTLDGAFDAFVTKVRGDGTMAWSSCLGGTAAEQGRAIAVRAPDQVIVAGYNDSPFDVFVTRIANPPPCRIHRHGCGLLGPEVLLLLALARLRRAFPRKSPPRGE